MAAQDLWGQVIICIILFLVLREIRLSYLKEEILSKIDREKVIALLKKNEKAIIKGEDLEKYFKEKEGDLL